MPDSDVTSSSLDGRIRTHVDFLLAQGDRRTATVWQEKVIDHIQKIRQEHEEAKANDAVKEERFKKFIKDFILPPFFDDGSSEFAKLATAKTAPEIELEKEQLKLILDKGELEEKLTQLTVGKAELEEKLTQLTVGKAELEEKLAKFQDARMQLFIKRMEQMPLRDLKFKKITEDDIRNRSSNEGHRASSCDVFVEKGSTQIGIHLTNHWPIQPNVDIVSFLQQAVVEEKSKSGEATYQPRQLKDVLSSVGVETLKFDLNIVHIYFFLSVHIDEIFRNRPISSDSDADAERYYLRTLEIILSPFFYLAAFDQSAQPTVEQYRENFKKWYGQHQVFFDSMRDLRQRIEAYEQQFNELEEGAAKDEMEAKLKHEKSKFDADQKLFFETFFSDSKPGKPGFERGFKFLSNSKSVLLKSMVQHKLQELRQTYTEDAHSPHEILKEMLGISMTLPKSRIQFPQNLQMESIWQTIHQSFYPVWVKADDLFRQQAYPQSFALLKVIEELKDSLDQLVAEFSQLEDSPQDSKVDDARNGQSMMLSPVQQAKVNTFLASCRQIFESAFTNEVLTEHRSFLSQGLSRLVEFFCKIFNSPRKFNTARITTLVDCQARLFSNCQHGYSSADHRADAAQPTDVSLPAAP